MKKSRKTLLISTIVLLGWAPAATVAATSAYTANAAVVGSSTNNGQKSNQGSTQNNNQNNQPSSNNNNNTNYNNNSTSTNSSGLSNIQELPSGSVVTLAGPSGFVYSLYTSSGSKASRGLAGDTAWVTDKSAKDSSVAHIIVSQLTNGSKLTLVFHLAKDKNKSPAENC